LVFRLTVFLFFRLIHILSGHPKPANDGHRKPANGNSALGKLGWTLRRIEEATGVRRETAGGYLKAAGIAVRPPGAWGRRAAKPANGVTTDSVGIISEKQPIPLPATNASASLCGPFRDTIELGLGRGRNAMPIWQDLVSQNGFGGGYETVKRFVRKLRGSEQKQPIRIIITGAAEEARSIRVPVPWYANRRAASTGGLGSLC
jgi:hypothetical protein